jgi:hypothetical protein
VEPPSGGEISRRDEVENASLAVRELLRDGRTDRRCLRCGGRLIFEDHGTAYVVRCENGDFKMTSRGL